MPAVTNVSSSTSFAFAKPASTSPYDHSTSGSPVGSLSSPARRKVAGRPFDLLQLRRADQAVVDGVAVGARVGAAREQALQRIDRERQLLEIDLDEVDRVLRDLLGVGRDGQDRLADPHRLVGQDRLGRRRQRGTSCGRQNAEHARQRERRGSCRRCARAHAASGSAGACRTPCLRRGSPPRTWPCRSLCRARRAARNSFPTSRKPSRELLDKLPAEPGGPATRGL